MQSESTGDFKRTWQPEVMLSHWVNRTAKLFARLGEIRLRPLGIGVAYLPVFALLSDGSRRSQASLAKLARAEQPTMALLLKRMEKAGLIRRDPDPADGRSSLISLSAKAINLIPAGRRVLQDSNNDATRGMTQHDVDQLVRLLRQVSSNLDSILERDAESPR